MQMSVLWVKNP